MAGTLTIDKNNTGTTTANVSGAIVDFDHTGITASGQTINNRAFSVALNSNSPTHVGTVNNFGIVNSVTGGTSGTQINYGLYNTVVSADTNVGIYQKVTDGGTDLQFVSSADTGDYFSIATTTHGATAITTVDDDATAANLSLDIHGSVTIEAATTVGIEAEGSDLTLTSARDTNVDAGRYIGLDAASAIWYFNKSGSSIASIRESNFLLKESSAAGGDSAGYGQIWVDDAAPNELAFTDDAGTDIVGIGKYHYSMDVFGYSGATTAILPMGGYVFEQTLTADRNEFNAMVAPFNGTLERVMFRCEASQSGTIQFDILEAADGTEIPATDHGTKDSSVSLSANTTLEINLSTMTTGTNVLTKGNLYLFKIITPSNSLDTNVTIVYKWDTTS